MSVKPNDDEGCGVILYIDFKLFYMEKQISALIVNDDSYIRYLYELIFEGFNNISYSSASTIEAAKVELQTYIPTFIFLDDSLPKGNVFPFVEYLNTNFPCIKIIISAEYDLVFQIKGGNKIIYQIIEKPFRVEDIKIVSWSLAGLKKFNLSNHYNSLCINL